MFNSFKIISFEGDQEDEWGIYRIDLASYFRGTIFSHDLEHLGIMVYFRH